MRSLLKQQGLWAPLSGKPTKEDVDEEKWNIREEKAHSTIILCLSDDVIIEVVDQETAAGLWLKLESLYMTKSLTNKLFLKKRLFQLRMLEGTPLRDHLDKLNKILLDLHNVDVKVEDEDAALIPLTSLPESYENFVESFTSGKDTMSLEEVRSALHSGEDRQLATGSAAENQASGLSVTGKGQKKYGKKKPNKKGSKGGPKPDDLCHYCKETGHWKTDCPKKKKKSEGGSAAVAENGSDSDEDLALVVDGQSHHNDVWVLDSGASYHICPNRESFLTYEQINGGNVSMANGAVCKVVGIGSIRIRTHDGVFCTLDEVRHVPQMTKNLISLSLLDSRGFSFKGEGGVMYVCQGSKVVLKGLKRGTLHFLRGSTVTGSADVASSEVQTKDMTKLWHMRLGHMGERGMQILSKRDLLSGHQVQSLEFCEHCVFGKLHRSKLPKQGVHQTKGTLDYIHMDCRGPSRVESIGGHMYFVLMIDDYSRMTWVIYDEAQK